MTREEFLIKMDEKLANRVTFSREELSKIGLAFTLPNLSSEIIDCEKSHKSSLIFKFDDKNGVKFYKLSVANINDTYIIPFNFSKFLLKEVTAEEVLIKLDILKNNVAYQFSISEFGKSTIKQLEHVNNYKNVRRDLLHPKFLYIYRGRTDNVMGDYTLTHPKVILKWLARREDKVAENKESEFLDKENPYVDIIINESGEVFRFYWKDNNKEIKQRLLAILKKSRVFYGTTFIKNEVEEQCI
ncbi:hypothetical protein SAMN00017405_2219 [Desulfonispora thiosulfatigenes DSM 11270]|uniref:Uncharacterized protein n=1 Tax=Desulfonispora thiosulfatigenes DSM 11270 TaxID=656914 RepID=A0A1W1VF14_DESTI|nr:hypothetical protein [Desulfonispora thiosulfatigenes]SMB91651.1 hypothetical protein SAMN00017405_2219 [Desulfonispora thiosulfatigenes DSM 11270]